MQKQYKATPARDGRFNGKRAVVALVCGAFVAGGVPAQMVPAPPSMPPASASAVSTPQRVLTLREAAQLAVLNNPEVLSRWHSVRAAEGEQGAARGALRPQVDLIASVGSESRSGVQDRYNRSIATLTLTQLLYDGFASVNEVKRLDHATRVRVFELVWQSETVALDAARAYLDVMRYRELVKLAEENFVEHRGVFIQTDQRVKARVARAVDLEQITGRLALAEANLLIETSNLHDTTARFQRIVGQLPSSDMPLPAHLAQGVPADARTAMARTYETNPQLLAAIENVRAANAALDTRKSAYKPRFDVRLKRDQGRNIDGVNGSNNATVAEVVMNWNLFNGFADRERERQFAEQVNVARDVRDKTCRDTRQTTAIAFNDIVKLKEQLEYLVVHEDSLTKALTAYRSQYQIGQRTLLDLLDTENERFQARRAVTNARFDLHGAYVRTHAGVGTLLQALELSRLQTDRESELSDWKAGGDAAQQCPVEPVSVYTVDKGALVQRALQQIDVRVKAAQEEIRVASAALTTTPPAAAPGTPATRPAPAATPSPAAPASSTDEAAVRAALEAWRAAWAKLDVGGYLRAYAADFTPPGGESRDAWEKRRRSVLGRSADVSLDVSDVKVSVTGSDTATVSFLQSYRSASYSDRVRKTLALKKSGGRWVIASETAEPAGR